MHTADGYTHSKSTVVALVESLVSFDGQVSLTDLLEDDVERLVGSGQSGGVANVELGVAVLLQSLGTLKSLLLAELCRKKDVSRRRQEKSTQRWLRRTGELGVCSDHVASCLSIIGLKRRDKMVKQTFPAGEQVLNDGDHYQHGLHLWAKSNKTYELVPLRLSVADHGELKIHA